MSRLILAAAMAVVATACTAAETEAPKDAATASEAAPIASSSAAASPQAAPLSAYVGKHPFDAVDGVTFVDHPLVRAAIDRSGAPTEARDFIRNNNTVVIPIGEMNGRLMSRGFEAASAGAYNWAVLIAQDGQRGAVCYSTPSPSGASTADWYIDGAKAFTRDGMCPDDAAGLAGFGTWPNGPIPR